MLIYLMSEGWPRNLLFWKALLKGNKLKKMQQYEKITQLTMVLTNDIETKGNGYVSH